MNLTFAKGVRDADDLDPVSQAILEVGSGTSIFDPVICEIAYRWFCPPNGAVLDPFAGGSVRGIVASKLGRRYVGIELRPEQVAANAAQLNLADGPRPEWRQGDAREIARLAGDIDADLIFSCPPYWNLERYSDDPADLSNMGREEFFAAYGAIIRDTIARLRKDRFAVWVIGDVRDEDGCYVNLPGRARTANEVIKAQERSVPLAKIKGELVDRARAVTTVFALARRERDAWVQWPARVAALMAAELQVDPHQMETVLEQHVRRHLAELSDVRVELR